MIKLDEAIKKMRIMGDPASWHTVLHPLNPVNEMIHAMVFEAYFNSVAWKNKRQMRLKLDNFQCTVCQTKFGLQVHHKTYENVGDEKMEELTTLCETHHAELHQSGEALIIHQLLKEQPCDWQKQLCDILGWSKPLSRNCIGGAKSIV